MFHDVNVLDLVEHHGDVEVLKEYIEPRFMIFLNDTQRGAGEYELIVSIGKIIAFHEGNDIIDQAEIHAAEQQYILARGRVGAVLGCVAMDFHLGCPLSEVNDWLPPASRQRVDLRS